MLVVQPWFQAAFFWLFSTFEFCKGGRILLTLPNGNCNGTPPDPQRTYQVVAATQDLGIGKDGKLPWRLRSDLKYFKGITLTTIGPGKKNAVIMGRKPWEIETPVDCDNSMPMLDTSVFHPWYLSFPVVENNIRYCFTAYVHVRCSALESLPQTDALIFNGKTDSVKFEVKNFTFLAKMIFERYEEYLYLRLVKDILLNGTPKDDTTGTDAV